MRLLFVAPYLPSPPRSGGERRVDALMRELGKRHDVSLLSLVDPADDVDERVRSAREYCAEVWVVPNTRYAASGASKRVLQARSLLGPASFERMAYFTQALQDTLRQLLDRRAFDVLQYEFVHTAFHPVPAHPGVTQVLDEHNVEFDVLRRTAEAEPVSLRKLYNAANWRKLRVEERRIWRRLDGCTLTSRRDERMLLDEAAGVRTAVVPNGVDVEQFAPRSLAATTPERVLFFGALNYYPNTEGVRFLLRDVFPRLKRLRPAARLRIVGQKPPPDILACRNPGVELVGFVNDVRDELASAAAVVVPLHLGGGTRLKVLEAMSMARPVVATPVGVEGIEVTPGRDALVANDAEGLARHLSRVLEDEVAALHLGAAARALVLSRYSWAASGERLSEFHAELVSERRAA